MLEGPEVVNGRLTKGVYCKCSVSNAEAACAESIMVNQPLERTHHGLMARLDRCIA